MDLKAAIKMVIEAREIQAYWISIYLLHFLPEKAINHRNMTIIGQDKWGDLDKEILRISMTSRFLKYTISSVGW